MKNAVFWDVAQCRFCMNRRFGGTSVHTRSRRRHIPEDRILHNSDIFQVYESIQIYLSGNFSREIYVMEDDEAFFRCCD
jgi:hypothetical protein